MDPLAAAPLECTVATVATARAREQKDPHSPLWEGVVGVPALQWGCVSLVVVVVVFYLFNPLQISNYYLQIYVVSDEKSAYFLIIVLYVTCSFASFKLLSYLWFSQFWYNVSK